MNPQAAVPESEKWLANLRLCAELTELAVRLRAALLSSPCGEEEAEQRVWAELREIKERAWVQSRSS